MVTMPTIEETPRTRPVEGLRSRARGLGILLLSVALAGPATSCVLGSQDVLLADDFQSCVVPMDHSSGHVRVDVWIGDSGPFLFQVDTYASIDVCVDQSFAERMDFPSLGQSPNSDGIQTRMRDYVRIESLRLGEARFEGARALVDDYGWVAQDGRPICGLLGFPLFRDLLWTLDYPRSRLVLRRGSLHEDAEHCVEYLLTTGSPDVRMQLGSREVVAGIDTGFGGSMLLPLSSFGDLTLRGELREVGSGRSAYSTFRIFGGTLLDTVELAGHRIRSPAVLFRDDDAKPLVGRDLLIDYEVTFDTAARRVQFKLPGPAEESDEGLEESAGPVGGSGGSSNTR